jgi:hypothetical protein
MGPELGPLFQPALESEDEVGGLEVIDIQLFAEHVRKDPGGSKMPGYGQLLKYGQTRQSVRG